MNDFASIPDAINDIKKGKMVVVVDEPTRENEGDLVASAEKIIPQTINFMTKYARGLICLPIISQRLKELKIEPMINDSEELKGASFTVSIDAKKGVTTGESAHDRAITIKTVLNKKTKPEDLARPGHIFPLRYREGGVLVRAGHTEAAVDLAKLAGLFPAGVICGILDEDGKMAKLPYLKKFAKKNNLKIITIRDLIEYRRKTEKLVKKIESAKLPTKYGEFCIHLYKDLINNFLHLAIVKDEVANKKNVLVRVHSSCLTGDIFHSLRCDCGDQLHLALKMIEKEGKGVVLYLLQEGRGIGLEDKIKAYTLQDKGLDTVEANKKLGYPPDLREYGIGAQILSDLGLSTIRLMTNNPKKIIGLSGYGLKVVGRVPLVVKPNPVNRKYLLTKKKKLGHLIENIF